jgi:hypothetical protein
MAWITSPWLTLIFNASSTKCSTSRVKCVSRRSVRIFLGASAATVMDAPRCFSNIPFDTSTLIPFAAVAGFTFNAFEIISCEYAAPPGASFPLTMSSSIPSAI